jgi:inhibitor of KinA
VPKGAVAIAGSQTGIYPLSSPGGWNLIGRTPNSIFNVDNPKESMLKMGDILRFKSINTEEYEATLL